MTNDIASYKSVEYSQRWRQSCFSQLRWWFLETITVVIIFFKHSRLLTMYREGVDGALIFCKTYWKQRFNYEIKLHGGLDDIDDIYHSYVLSCKSVHFFVGLKDRGTDFVLIERPWPLPHTWVCSHFPATPNNGHQTCKRGDRYWGVSLYLVFSYILAILWGWIFFRATYQCNLNFHVPPTPSFQFLCHWLNVIPPSPHSPSSCISVICDLPRYAFVKTAPMSWEFGKLLEISFWAF